MTDQNQVYPVGIDVGFGEVKIVKLTDGKPRMTAFPAILGNAESTPQVTLRLHRNLHRARTTRIVYQGQTFFVGEDALRYSRAYAARQDRQRIGSLEERVLMLAALTRLDIYDCQIITGLPVAWFDPADRRRLAHSWKGIHTLEIKGQTHTVRVRRVLILPQPFGGLYARILDDQGQLVVSFEELQKPYAFLDVGFNTTDFTAIDRMEMVGRWSGGIQVGMRRVVEIVLNRLQREYDLELALLEGDRVIRDGRTVIAHGQEVDLVPLVEEAVGAVARQIVGRATQLWGNGSRFRRVYIFGGGAAVMGSALRAAFPRNGEVLPKPALANALGFAKFALWEATQR